MNAPPALTPTLPVPAGWSPGFLPGADLLMMPLPGQDRISPVFTVRRWNTNADLPEGTDVHDPRTDSSPDSPRFGAPDGPDPARGVPVGMDRWSGGDWFGLRFLRLVPSLTGRPAAETRWLLWSALSGVPEGFDPQTSAPDLDVTAVCGVADLSLLEMPLDSMAGAVPTSWAPALTPGHPSARSVVEVERRTPDDGRAPFPERLTTAGAWQGAPMSELTPAAVEFLRSHRPDAAWGALQDEAARPLMEAGFADAGTRRLTDRATVAATILQNAERVSKLTVTSRHGRHHTLELHSAGGVVVAIAWARPMKGLPDEALLGLFPVERSAELVLRAAALGPSDSRRLTVDTVPRDLLVQRSLMPSTAVPEDLAGDPRWEDLWDAEWLLWGLETETRAATGDSDPEVTTFIALNAGRHGNQVLTRPAGEASGAHGDTHDEVGQGPSVRLVPAQTSSLLVTLLNRLTPSPKHPSGARPRPPR
ncbi:hypothetical protein [Microbacterium sp. A93]|uniref:hypothetical protein n=1 Tax=Microbacterium sp. A93 TaxID=3450716 RepID=UPI003F42CB3D